MQGWLQCPPQLRSPVSTPSPVSRALPEAPPGTQAPTARTPPRSLREPRAGTGGRRAGSAGPGLTAEQTEFYATFAISGAGRGKASLSDRNDLGFLQSSQSTKGFHARPEPGACQQPERWALQTGNRSSEVACPAQRTCQEETARPRQQEQGSGPNAPSCVMSSRRAGPGARGSPPQLFPGRRCQGPLPGEGPGRWRCQG